jgi:hypothetical protein
MNNRRVSISLALIVLICFFLPWIQVSCGASEDRLGGIDLAREGHNGLWLIPILMLVILFVGLARSWKVRRQAAAVVTLVSGLLTAYLMNRERARADNSSGLIAVNLTGWFWLALGSAILLVALSVVWILKRPTAR